MPPHFAERVVECPALRQLIFKQALVASDKADKRPTVAALKALLPQSTFLLHLQKVVERCPQIE